MASYEARNGELFETQFSDRAEYRISPDHISDDEMNWFLDAGSTLRDDFDHMETENVQVL